jgi:hypothetical protein
MLEILKLYTSAPSLSATGTLTVYVSVDPTLVWVTNDWTATITDTCTSRCKKAFYLKRKLKNKCDINNLFLIVCRKTIKKNYEEKYHLVF